MNEDYALFSVVCVRGGKEMIYKADQRPDFAMKLALSVWKNNQPLDAVLVKNQRTGLTRDSISRDH